MSASFFLYRAATRLRRELDRRLERFANHALARHYAARRGRIGYVGIERLQAEDGERWRVLAPSDRGRLTIVVVTYRQPIALECLLASLRCQTLQNFDLIVIHDGADAATRSVVDAHTAAAGAPCRYIETATRYNDYGHTLRDIGLKAATGEFTLITNGDNYYAPRLVEFAFDAVDRERLDLVLWNMVHSHPNAGNTGAPGYVPFTVYPFWNRIDIGAFMVRTSIAREIGFNDRSHDADAVYMQQLLERTPVALRIGKLEKTLMVHN